MFNIAIEIVVCVIFGIGLTLAFFFCQRFNPVPDAFEKQEKMNFSSTSSSEAFLIQTAFITYYEQQRNELIAMQQTAVDDAAVTIIHHGKDESGYVSLPATAQTPHSLYECTGFASMDNLAVSNPLFAGDTSDNHEQPSTPLSLTTV